MVMNIEVAVMILLVVLGAGLGSFACCQAWRIRKHDKSRRSHCMNCDYQLKWFDNIPILSWLFLRGKCRKCGKKIGWAELFSELLMAVAFGLSFWLWPWRAAFIAGDVFEIIKFAIFLVELVIFGILFVYDAKWKEMPTNILVAGMAVGLAYYGIVVTQTIVGGSFELSGLMSLAGAMLILPGFYYFMYRMSKEKWVGGGDPMLCVPMALMLGNFWLAMACLFISNVIGSIVMVPVTTVKRQKHAMIPLGPFLILGFLVIFFWQSEILGFIGF
jgi:prepilin signal peptidase PulO-like enzyme (type II secretory pathway)